MKGAKGYDLYILLRHSKRHRRQSSVMNFEAVKTCSECGHAHAMSSVDLRE